MPDLPELDRIVHEPARLTILTILGEVRHADFLFLQRITGLTGGNLSRHLAKLEEADLVEIEKGYVGRRPITTVYLTATGASAICEHWLKLDRLRNAGSVLDDGMPTR